MKKFILLPIFVSITVLANSTPFASDNPYQEISTIEKKQIRGEDFVEVYEVQNNIEKSSFDFFGLLNTETEEIQSENLCDPSIDNCNADPADPPLPVPINQFGIVLILFGVALIFKRKFY